MTSTNSTNVFVEHRAHMDEIAGRLATSKTSKVLSDEKYDRIVSILKKESVSDRKLKFTVKKKNYQLATFVPLNLVDVLCVPCSPTETGNAILGSLRRVAKVSDLYDIVYFVHTQMKIHRGYKKTLSEVS